MNKVKALDDIAVHSRDELVNCVYDIALICKRANYPEDLMDIYDVLVKYDINYKELGED